MAIRGEELRYAIILEKTHLFAHKTSKCAHATGWFAHATGWFVRTTGWFVHATGWFVHATGWFVHATGWFVRSPFDIPCSVSLKLWGLFPRSLQRTCAHIIFDERKEAHF
jgi:hypothetical protein